jgi:hypothetical protein
MSLMEEISNPESLRLAPIYVALYEAAMTDLCAGLTDEYDFRTGTAAIEDHVHDSIHKILLDNISTVLALASIEAAKRHRDGKGDIERLASLTEAVSWAVACERDK